MKYCSNCGKEITDDAKFCYSCGKSVDGIVITDNTSKPKSETASSTSVVEGIGIALIIIGIILGIFAGFYLIGRGELFGYNSWDYYYGGVKETGIWFAVIAAASLLIGVVMVACSGNSRNK